MTTTSDLDIAVIGLSCEFAGNASLDSYWQMMLERQCAVRTLDASDMQARGAAAHAGAEGIIARIAALRDMAGFDNRKFGLSAHEANIADPQLRLLLKHASHALRSSGYDPALYWGEVGVFGSASISMEWAWEVRDSLGAGRPLGIAEMPYVERDFYMTRMAYHLGLRGPAVLVNTACSSSHAAIHMAVQSLLAGDCDMALACASSARPFWGGYPHQEGGFFSPSGQCLPFCAGADGTVPGEGAAVLVLKRLETALEDGDKVFCVIKSSALNNDGNQKPGYAGPSEARQSAVIEAALAAAGIAPERLAYVECHGTGTRLGDPIEISALKRALKRWGKSGPLQIGSVKANIGHTDVVAGFAGLIKAALVLHHRTVPPQILASELNELCRFDDGALALAREAQALSGEGKLCAGISSFGVGGTNGYVVIEGGDANFQLPPAAPEAAQQFDTILRRPNGRRAAAASVALPVATPAPDDIVDTAVILELLAEHSEARDLHAQSRLQDLAIDSITVIMITEAITKRYGAAPSPAQFVELATVADLVAAVRAPSAAGGAAPAPAVPQDAPPFSRLTLGQGRYFSAQVADPALECYSALFRVSAKVPEGRLRQAVAQTILRHQGLRARFAPDAQGRWLAHYTDYPSDGYFAVLDHADAGEFDIDACRAQVAGAMRFEQGPLFCARLVRRAGKDSLMLLVASHVLFDGYSLNLIFKDLMGYFTGAAYSPAPVTPVALYANYQNSWFEAIDARQERAYWERDEWTQARPLPADAEAGVAGYGHEQCELRHYLSEQASAALLGQLKEHKVAMLDLILYAVAGVYLEEAGGDWLQVACAFSGRGEVVGASGLDFSGTVGSLVLNGLLLLERPRGNSALERIADIKRQMSAIPAKGTRYFAATPDAGDSQAPRLPHYDRQIGVNFQGYEGHNPSAVDSSEIAFERQLLPNQAGAERWYKVELQMGFTDGRFYVLCLYSGRQYQRATIERYVGGIVRRMQGFGSDTA